MQSYEIYNYYKFTIEELEEMSNYLESLFKWQEEYSDVIKTIVYKIISCGTSTSGTDVHYIVKGGKIKEEYNNIRNKLKEEFGIIPFTILFGNINGRIKDYKINNDIPKDYIESFIEETNKFLTIYQNWWKEENVSNFIELGNKIISYKDMFCTIKNMYMNFINLYTENDLSENFNNKQSIEIQLLDVKFNLEEFNDILNSINVLYNEIGNILYPYKGSCKFEKLKIIKIESGSIFADLLGDEGILKVIAKVLNKAADAIFNKFTFEGKVGRQEEINHMIKENLDLKKEIEDTGIKLDVGDEEIQKAYIIATKNLTKIISSTTKIKINDEIHEIKRKEKNNYLNPGYNGLLVEKNENIEE